MKVSVEIEELFEYLDYDTLHLAFRQLISDSSTDDLGLLIEEIKGVQLKRTQGN